MTACPVATQIPGYECMNDLTTKRSFYSQDMRVIHVLGLTDNCGGLYNWQTSVRLMQQCAMCLCCKLEGLLAMQLEYWYS